MVKGIYTGASGMQAEQARLDIISNNLANIDTTGFKKDTMTFKSFPEMLLARTNDDGVTINPLGSSDTRPYVGRLGTGVEVNEVFTEWEQGSLRETSNALDLALSDRGFFAIDTPDGERYTRNGSFIIDKDLYLVTKEGYRVMGENGHIQIKTNNFRVDEEGNVFINKEYQDDPNIVVQMRENEWREEVITDTLKIVRFDNERFLLKEGESLWKDTNVSGEAYNAEYGNDRPQVLSGFLEMSNVNPVEEMVRMIEVQRAYELNSKVITTHDALVGRAVNEVGKI